MPRRDQGTRWNSWYEMINRVLEKIKPQIQSLLAEEAELKDDNLTPDDWEVLLFVRDFLASFYDTTKATEGRKATLDRVLPSLDFMAFQFTEAIQKYRSHPFMHGCLQAGFSKLLKY